MVKSMQYAALKALIFYVKEVMFSASVCFVGWKEPINIWNQTQGCWGKLVVLNSCTLIVI